jgi:hypothetical protein
LRRSIMSLIRSPRMRPVTTDSHGADNIQV